MLYLNAQGRLCREANRPCTSEQRRSGGGRVDYLNCPVNTPALRGHCGLASQKRDTSERLREGNYTGGTPAPTFNVSH